MDMVTKEAMGTVMAAMDTAKEHLANNFTHFSRLRKVLDKMYKMTPLKMRLLDPP